MDRWWRIIVPTLAVCIFLGIWQLSNGLFGVPVYLLPRPTDFLGEFIWNHAVIWRNAIATSSIILGGFVIGTAVAIPLALLIVGSTFLQRGLYPLLVILQIAPKTIVAPLLIVWFGTGSASKLMLTTAMTFFPILVDSMTGFRAVDPRLYYLSRTMGATQIQTFFRIRLPAAMPHIFSGLKIGMVSAVTGSMVVEYIGSNNGLGYLTLYALSHFDMPLMFAAILATALVGLVFNAALVSAERLLMPWVKNDRED